MLLRPLQGEPELVPLQGEPELVPLQGEPELVPLQGESELVPLQVESELVPLQGESELVLKKCILFHTSEHSKHLGENIFENSKKINKRAIFSFPPVKL